MRRFICTLTAVLFVLVAAVRPLAAQASVAPPDTSNSDAVRVFIDCQNANCDRQFFVDQMKWVNFVRDRVVADVTLLVTSLRTGSGGSEYTIAAIGGEKYRGRADTVLVYNQPNDAEDVVRRRLMRTFALVLGPYAAKTSAAQRLTLSYAPPTGPSAAAQAIKDPWNFWIYRVSANGFGSGEMSQSFGNMFLSASANRVTADWKINLGSNVSYDQSQFDIGSGQKFKKIQRDYGTNVLIVKSLSDHWSAGMTANAQHSDFSNYDLNLRVQPALEWNFFPYKDFTRRQLTAFYTLGMQSVRYQDTTIYNTIKESNPQHTLNVAWNARQTWGSVNLSLFGSQYLHNTSFNGYGVSGFTDLRLTRGLSINIGGSYSRVNDQLYLRRGTLTPTQVVARQEALATNYRYFVNFGISYTFGSIFNNVVNPRFNSSRGGGGGFTISF